MFDEILKGIDERGILSVDLETTSKDPFEAEILLIAMASGFGRNIRSVAVRPTQEAISFLQEQFRRPKIRIVGFNFFNFDLEVLHNQGIVKMIPQMDIQAKVVDVLPMVWLLNENLPHGLKYSVKKYLNYDMTTYDEAFVTAPSALEIRRIKKELKEIQKEKIDKIPSKLRTLRMAHKKKLETQLKELFQGRRTKADNAEKRAKRAEIASFLAERYGEMEKSKFIPNPEVEKQMGQQMIEELIEPRNKEIEHLYLDLANTQREYAKDDAKQTLRLYYHARKLLKEQGIPLSWVDMEIQVKRISSQMELRGIHLEHERVNEVVDAAEPLLKEFEAQVFDIAKQEFNLNSPMQLKKVLYEDLGIRPFMKTEIVNGEEIRTPDYSTKEAILVRMEHPIAPAILNHRMLSKLLSAFGHKIRDRLEGESKRLHVRFNTNGPRTGRWSSSNFNAQQIPSRKKPHLDERIQGLGPHIRFAFKAPPGMKYIGADLSQIELRLIAHITQDYNLLRIYNESTVWNGIEFFTGDIHDETRQSISKMAGFDIGRKLSKNINFGLCFDMSPKGFARYARIYKEGTHKREYDFALANTFWNGFHDTYPGIRATIGNCKEIYRSSESHGGFPDRTRWKKFRILSGRFRRFLNPWRTDEPASPGTIFNSMIQGGAADILKVIIWAIDKYVIQHPDFAGTELVMQVHDEVGLYAPEEIARKVAILVKYIMEIMWFRIDVPVLASCKVTDDWQQQDSDSFAEIGVMPPESTGIKPCVAILSPKQKKWASQYLPETTPVFNFREENTSFIPIDQLEDVQ